MSAAINPAGDPAQQERTPAVVGVGDPALVVVYFYSGAADGASAVEARLDAIFGRLASGLQIYDPFVPSISRTDLGHIDFVRYQWSSTSLATLVQLYVKPSQVWCVQVALPVRPVPTSLTLEEALTAWRETEEQLNGLVGDLAETGQEGVPTESAGMCWGSSRLYWALSDEMGRTPSQSFELAREVQSIVCPPPSAHRGGQDDSARLPVVQSQAYDPQGHAGDCGTLWRLDEPAIDDGPYQAAWLLLSPHAQNDAVALDYVFNGRFAIGEAYLCKAHYQAREYTGVSDRLRGAVHSVQSEIEALLTLEAPSGFAPDQIRQALADLEQRQEHIQRVATACSRLLSALSVVDRLHLTVKTNLDNYEQMAAAFHLWEHPASQSEIGTLQVVLRQIEHDQRSRGASLQGFQTAIETVRAGLDTSRNRLDTARLEVQQTQVRASEIWNFVISIVAAVLGAGQVAGLTPRELGVFLRIGAPLLVCLALPFLVRALWPLWKRCTGRRRKQ